MIAEGEDELICDLAETYGVMDMWALPIPLLATLASGLRDDSRVKVKISGQKIGIDRTMMAMAVDYLGLLAWIQSGSARQGNPRPDSVLTVLQGRQNVEEKENDNGLRQFDSPEDFQRAWRELTGG